MNETAKKNAAKRKSDVELDKELDSELEGTFPASDPLKITRAKPATPVDKTPPRRKSR
jgi:hypothetical protein